MAIIAAVLCLIFAAVNDLLFKAFARKPRSKGVFVSLVGIIWLCISFYGLNLHPQWGPTIFWGCVSGFFSSAGNLLLLEAMKRLEAGVSSTLYRLNMVPAILGAAIFLDETISVLQWIGVICALCAIIGFFPHGQKNTAEQNKNTAWKISFAMVIIASLMRAGMGLSYRYGFLHGADRSMVVAVNALFWVFGGLIYAVFREKTKILPDKGVVKYGILSGVCVTGVVVTMAISLQYGKASIVLPIAQMSFLLTAVLGALFLKEKITARKLLALFAGAAAIILLSM